ncbi:double zinc ribbon and ankyrin repeat-containing protein 1 isoform X1 [Cygnus olor]|uniref:double zinc ribbon and ankyrin repeat-containing protein 1 isoform X1 n=2 Tax=Cygnus olor TaxID=8869 RepID=UPI001ADEB443|nr:double zinc ribbon and ankyrin repeat-containing protein 1 isoform X1 [Cygnus olor]XP_040409530.1 double zinc ribbon and ankyrin repeat-containing protein 1 isoform X1 [Cygnus olor]XP_040409531.1 double zinc ribbon and ankyrin repeat-containing protein 1 isoform X1 [Cygnus olor]XP_040409532.1 double zinc ribbon and ankyrin repeat-containing protein 1 isoform X1 [Cygnus olor]
MTAGSVSVPQVIPLRIPLPGKAKHEIDTNTLVEIKSDTPEVSIYYTLDGSKPEPNKKPGYGEHNTFKYKSPIILPVGKIMVKALAVTKDCRESTVVTKVFLVEYKQPNIFSIEDNDKNFLKDVTTQEREDGLFTTKSKKNGMNVEIKPAWSEAPQDFQDLETEKKTYHKSLQGPQLLTCHLETTGYREESVSALPTESLQFASSSVVTSRKSLASTQVARIQRETNFLRCAHCSAPRLSDPLAHFCQECGSPIPPVPVRHFPPPEGAQMAPCLECRHLVPMNTPTCIVCESPIAPQLQPQTNICLKGKVICQACGTGNPLHHKYCVTCESKLPEAQMHVLRGDSPPAYTSQQGKTVSCSKCNRVNQCDARFCDWCGAKPDPPPCYFTCFKCGTNNRPYARFCAFCGVYVEPPSRASSQNGVLLDAGDSLRFSETKPPQAQVAWQSLPISLSKSRVDLKETEDKGTQTIGLFYPSSKLLEKKELELILHKEKLEKMSDRKPLLTAISPGKGYWRKQLDHVCAHLRSYAQNNLEFRALIGEPRMGKITSAAICENDYQVTITLNYTLASNKDIHTSKPAKFNNHYLNSVTEDGDDLDGSQTSFGKEDHDLSHSRGKIKRTKSRMLTEKEDKLPPESRQLLDELGPHGKGRITLIEQLLSKGADPNCTGEDDRPALTVAVRNRHAEAISVLVQKGANVDQQSGLYNNTALHEAVLLGLEGKECVRVLLRCNASIKKKNTEGESAYDLAVTDGNNEVISLFASKLGEGMLDKLTKPRNIGLISV